MSHDEIMRDLQSPQENGKLDLVNVVRCKYCKYRLNHYCHHEDTYDLYVHMDGYCSRGERQDE